MTLTPEYNAAYALLEWYADQGVDEAISALSVDRLTSAAPSETADPRESTPARPATPIFAKEKSAPAPDEAVRQAREIAQGCQDMPALITAIEGFDGCPLKAGARNTVICDGVFNSDLLVIGEAPGADEDRQGKPFVGRAGQLLDKMLAAIGRSRTENTLISNAIFWRPPGNRTPTQTETAICRPFVDRLIELTSPKVILLAGGAPMQALLGVTGIMRMRGRFQDFETPDGRTYTTLPIFHPAFLLRQPGNKRLAWDDLQKLEARLRED